MKNIFFLIIGIFLLSIFTSACTPPLMVPPGVVRDMEKICKDHEGLFDEEHQMYGSDYLYVFRCKDGTSHQFHR